MRYSKQIKELVCNIIYSQEENKFDDNNLVNKDISLISYLIRFIYTQIDKSYEAQALNLVYASKKYLQYV